MKQFTSRIILYLCLLSSIASCIISSSRHPDQLEQNLNRAGKNRSQLEEVINHYQADGKDSLKVQAAIFLISNMESNGQFSGRWLQRFDSIFQYISTVPNDRELLKIRDSIEKGIGKLNDSAFNFSSDLSTLSADYLIRNIDEAFERWTNSPWVNQVSFNTFCNYILPYKMNSEPMDTTWRQDLKNEFQQIADNSMIPNKMEEVCCVIIDSQKLWFKYTEVFSDYPSILGLKSILQGHYGACAEMAILGAYSNRAMGIPVAIDFTPQWGNHLNGHTWNALILNENYSLPFLGAESRPGDYADIRESEGKIAKAYRYQYEFNSKSFAAVARSKGILKIPLNLRNPRLLDVTSLYVPCKSVELNVDQSNNSAVYIGIFQNGKWNPIAGSWVTDAKAFFNDIGPEVLYVPLYFSLNKYKPAGFPFIIPIDGLKRQIKPNRTTRINMSLYRKYPVKRFRARNHALGLVGDRFEASNHLDFKDAQLLYIIPEPIENYKTKSIKGYTIRDDLNYKNLWENADLSTHRQYRYIRLIGALHSPFNIGEISFYSEHDTMALSGTPIGNVAQPTWAFDGWNGFSIMEENSDTINRWVGLDLGRPYPINHLKYLPANDRNTIIPNKTYEFYYWDNKWISLGIQKAVTHKLNYDQVIDGTIYWLRCLDCNSTEERPFTYENGTQIWW